MFFVGEDAIKQIKIVPDVLVTGGGHAVDGFLSSKPLVEPGEFVVSPTGVEDTYPPIIWGLAGSRWWCAMGRKDK